MWQDIIVHIIVVLAVIYTVYNGILFFLPSGSKTDDTKCPGCSGGCSTHNQIDFRQLRQFEK